MLEGLKLLPDNLTIVRDAPDYSDMVMLALHYYLFRNNLDDVVELINMRGLYLCHQTVHNWTQTFGVEVGLNYVKDVGGKLGNPLIGP